MRAGSKPGAAASTATRGSVLFGAAERSRVVVTRGGPSPLPPHAARAAAAAISVAAKAGRAILTPGCSPRPAA